MNIQQLRNIKNIISGMTNSIVISNSIRSSSFPGEKIILIYHGVTENLYPNKYNTKFISHRSFIKQINEMKKHFNFISLDQYAKNDIDNTHLNIALTFDDGFLNNFNLACPILDELNIQATFFIPTVFTKNYDILCMDLYNLSFPFLPKIIEIEGCVFHKRFSGMFDLETGLELRKYAITKNIAFIEKLYQELSKHAIFRNKNELNDFWKLMSVEQIAKISRNSLFTIGSHGNMHIAYSHAEKQETADDMIKSKQALEAIIGKKVSYLAAPYGLINNEVLEISDNSGYDFLLSAEHSEFTKASSGRIWNRQTINPYLSAKNQLLFIKKSLC